MSLIVGQYYRGNSKQKPEQWGPVSHCESAVRSYFEDVLGECCPTAYTPFWDNAGQSPTVFFTSNITTAGPVWVHNGLSFDGNDDTAYFSSGGDLTPNNQLSVFVHGKLLTLPTGNEGLVSKYVGRNSSGTYIDERSWGLLLTSAGNIRSVYSTTGANEATYVVDNTKETISTGDTFSAGLVWEASTRSDTYNLISKVSGTPAGSIHTSSYPVQIGNTYHEIGFPDAASTIINALFYSVIIALSAYSDNTLYTLADNPYAAIKPPTFRTYFDLSETPTGGWPKKRTLTGPFWGPFGGI